MNPLAQAAADKRQAQKNDKTRLTDLKTLVGSSDEVQRAVIQSIKQLILFLHDHEGRTSVTNHPKSISTPDVDKVVKSIAELEKSLKAKNNNDIVGKLVELLTAVGKLPKEFPVVKIPDSVKVNNQPVKELQAIEKAVNKLKLDPKFTPKIEVKPTDVKVEAVDFQPLVDVLVPIRELLEREPLPPQDLSPLSDKLSAIRQALQDLVDKPMPATRFRASFSEIVQLTADGKVPTSSSSGLLGDISYDQIDLGYSGDNVTSVTFKEDGTTVTTLTLAYSGDNVTSITKS